MGRRGTPEGKFKDAVVSELKNLERLRYPITWWLPTDDVAGIPDIVGCARSIMFGLELKVDAPLDPRQHLFLMDLALAGGIAATIRSTASLGIEVRTYHPNEVMYFDRLSLAIQHLLPSIPVPRPEG